MPQDQETGANGNSFGRKTARVIAKNIGAKMLTQTSNEATHNGSSIVIKCASEKTTNIGVTFKMLNRLDSIIGSFEQEGGAFELYELSVETFKVNMRTTKSKGPSAGKVGVVSKSVFIKNGKKLKTVWVQ